MLELILKDNNGKVYSVRTNNIKELLIAMNKFIRYKYQVKL